jgi:SPP1 family predicted phage head-tail adaptor
VTVRFRSDIGTDMRIQYQARNFNIKHIRNVDERDRFLLLMCNEGEAT